MTEDCLSEPGEGSRKIKVVDKRRFDGSGELRPDMPAPEPKPVEPPIQETAAPTPAATDELRTDAVSQVPTEPESTGSTTSPLFLDLIAGLAQQAEILMTGGQGMSAQPAEAQRVIEYLSMLESKTKGNVSSEEQQVLANVIFQLRSLFVQHKT